MNLFTRIAFCLWVMPALAATVLDAETSATPPAGYFKLTAQGASDTLLALPLARRTAWMGRVTAVTADQVNLATATPVLTGAASPSAAGWYYAEFVTGALAGLAYPVVSNVDGSFILQTAGDDLTAHALGAIVTGESGDIVRIRSGWSLATVFGEDETRVLASTQAFTGSVYLSGDAVMLPDNETMGAEKKPAQVFAYIEGLGWRQRGAVGDVNAGGDALLPWVPFTVRRQSSTPAEVLVVGYVPMESQVVRLPAVPVGGEIDFAVSWGHADSRRLDDSGLAGVIDPSVNALNAGDLLLDYASGRRGFSRPPEHAFHLIGEDWLEADVNQNGFMLSPGVGYLLRVRGERPVRYWVQPKLVVP